MLTIIAIVAIYFGQTALGIGDWIWWLFWFCIAAEAVAFIADAIS